MVYTFPLMLSILKSNSVCLGQLGAGLCVNPHLQKIEASQMRPKRCSDLEDTLCFEFFVYSRH